MIALCPRFLIVLAVMGLIFIGLVFIVIAQWSTKHDPIPVLIYHGIAATTTLSDAYDVEASLLSRELDYLNQHSYTPLTFADARSLAEKNRLPKHPVIISFDDTLRSQVTSALPLLQKHNMPATFFINSDWVGNSEYMNWDDVRALAAAGMEIGGHSETHAHLAVLDDAALVREVSGDKVNIEREIGKPVIVFAYPYQEYDARTDAAVQHTGYTIVRDDASRFKSAVMTNSFDAFLQAI